MKKGTIRRVSPIIALVVVMMALVSCQASMGSRFERSYHKVSEGDGPALIAFDGKRTRGDKVATIYQGQLAMGEHEPDADFLLSIYEVPDNDAVFFASLMYYDKEENGYVNQSLYFNKSLDAMVVEQSNGDGVLVYSTSADAEPQEILSLFDRYLS